MSEEQIRIQAVQLAIGSGATGPEIIPLSTTIADFILQKDADASDEIGASA